MARVFVSFATPDLPVAREVAKTHPGKTLGCFAYVSGTITPPPVPIPQPESIRVPKKLDPESLTFPDDKPVVPSSPPPLLPPVPVILPPTQLK